MVGLMVELLDADTKLMARLTIVLGSRRRVPRSAQHRMPAWTDDQSNFGRLERDVAALASLHRAAGGLEASASSSATGRGSRAWTDRRE
jgi:hypothetical protein